MSRDDFLLSFTMTRALEPGGGGGGVMGARGCIIFLNSCALSAFVGHGYALARRAGLDRKPMLTEQIILTAFKI